MFTKDDLYLLRCTMFVRSTPRWRCLWRCWSRCRFLLRCQFPCPTQRPIHIPTRPPHPLIQLLSTTAALLHTQPPLLHNMSPQLLDFKFSLILRAPCLTYIQPQSVPSSQEALTQRSNHQHRIRQPTRQSQQFITFNRTHHHHGHFYTHPHQLDSHSQPQ